MRTDRQPDMKKLIIAFRDFAKALQCSYFVYLVIVSVQFSEEKSGQRWSLFQGSLY